MARTDRQDRKPGETEQREAPAPEPVAGYALVGPISFGLALGAVWAFSVFVLAIVAALFDWGIGLAAMLSSLYVGYGPTFVGAVAGAVWGFVHGFVFGLLAAWLYNRFLIGRLRRRG